MSGQPDEQGDFADPNQAPIPVCPQHGPASDMTPEERLLHAIFGKCACDGGAAS